VDGSLTIFVFMWKILFFICSGGSLLSSNEFWVIYKAILVLVVAEKKE